MSQISWPFLQGDMPTITRADGLYLYNDREQEILDAAGGAIVANVGWGRARVADAMATAAKDLSYVVPPWITPSREALVEELKQHWLPPSLTRIQCSSGGTEANETALKIALQYQQAIGETRRTTIIGRTIGYHGTSLATASISGHPGRKKGLEAALPFFPATRTPYPLRCPLGPHHPDAGKFYIDVLQDVIESEGADTIAAILAEPITGSSGGALVPPDDYWPAVREICDQHGILLIMDEVMTGFGRTGTPFGYQHWPIEPDILVGGKGLAGGYAPLGGVFGTEKIGQALSDAGYQVMFNTFGAHPASCAAAVEVLSILREENLVAQATARGEYLERRLEEAFGQHPQVAEARGRGLLRAIEIVIDRESLERFEVSAAISGRVVGEGLKRGVFFYGGGTGDVRDIVCMGPAFTISEAQIDFMVETLLASVDAVIAKAL
ncbi:MAG: aminotransferase class III-fold pyridoxal phosphate-dependent enzyme [Pseudomonadota bacterium]